jgi:hypothetical protein
VIVVAVLVITLAKQATDLVNDRRQRQVLTWLQGATSGRHHGEDDVRQRDQGAVPVPGVRSAELVLVEPEGHVGLEADLVASAGAGHPDEGAQGYRSRRPAAAEGQFPVTEAATHQRLSAQFSRILFSPLFGSYPATLFPHSALSFSTDSSTLHRLMVRGQEHHPSSRPPVDVHLPIANPQTLQGG